MWMWWPLLPLLPPAVGFALWHGIALKVSNGCGRPLHGYMCFLMLTLSWLKLSLRLRLLEVFLYLKFSVVLLEADMFTRPLIGNNDASGGKTASEASKQRGRISALMLPDSLVSADGWMSARLPSLTHHCQFPGDSQYPSLLIWWGGGRLFFG